ncbi:sensor histidine kinase [Methylocystis sp. H62]|uniref:sensor histidine kinase n=1 Tax=Methylocystis sp. H62 TaxID=2785789 RepID=UPI001FEFB2A2|nr:histidine kinase dimerization/phosphoacceptor domain -containing protein [Methylocystis sp. H62]
MACSRSMLWGELGDSFSACALARLPKISDVLSGYSGRDAALRMDARRRRITAFSCGGWYLFYPPAYSFEIKDANTVVALVGFLLVGGFLVVLVAAMGDVIKRLERANRAQESLFRELQHRVANNLQVVVAMLQGVRRDLSDEATAEAIANAQDRIAMMSDLHGRLYDRKAYEHGLAPLMSDVLHEVFRDLPVLVVVEIAPDIDLSLDQMTAISLLVNEAAMNAAKHVFRKGTGTTFKVELLKQKDGLRLLIHDDGPGIRRDSTSERQSLGMSIMQTFARQLGGSLRINGPTGTTLKVEFPLRSNH